MFIHWNSSLGAKLLITLDALKEKILSHLLHLNCCVELSTQWVTHAVWVKQRELQNDVCLLEQLTNWGQNS